MIKNTSKTDAVTVKITTLPPTQPKELTPKEQSEFKAQEKIIEDNYDSSFALAAALHTIKVKKLYRAEYETFENYMEKRWNYCRSYGQRLLKVNEVMTDLQKVPEAAEVLPRYEAQARIYADLDSSQRHTLLRKALEESPNQPPTSKLLVEWKQELFPKTLESEPKKKAVGSVVTLKNIPTGKRLVSLYNTLVSIYDMDFDCDGESDYNKLMKEIIDQYKPLLDPEAVKEVAKEEEEEAARKAA